MDRSKTINILKKNTMLLVLAAIMVVFEILMKIMNKGSLFAPTNISNLIGQNGYVVVLATGMLLCILTGGNIDLSIGSQVALVGALGAKLMITYRVNIYVTIVICIVAGLLIGAFQGALIAYLRIPAFIVTLAGMLIYRGIAWVILQGATVSAIPDEFKKYFNNFFPQIEGVANDPEVKAHVLTVSLIIGVVFCAVIILSQIFTVFSRKRKGYVYENWEMILKVVSTAVICAVIMWLVLLLGQNKGVPVIMVILLVVVLGYNYFTSNTVPGRHFYAMGGNEKAAKLSGVNTDNILFAAYTNMGFLCAVASLMCIARFNSAAPSAGTGYEMDAIAACYIGGASAYGGVGTVSGAVIGAIFMGVMNNGMSILGLASDWQRVVKGVVLLLAVIFDVLSRRRKQAA